MMNFYPIIFTFVFSVFSLNCSADAINMHDAEIADNGRDSDSLRGYLKNVKRRAVQQQTAYNDDEVDHQTTKPHEEQVSSEN